MKTNRQTILEAIAKAPRSTIDELITATDWPRKKVHDTVNDLAKIDLITRDRDDVTGLPCYRLTKKGAEAINAMPSAPAEPLADEAKPCCTGSKVIATTAGAEIAALKTEITRREHELITQTALVVELRQRIADLEAAVDITQQRLYGYAQAEFAAEKYALVMQDEMFDTPEEAILSGTDFTAESLETSFRVVACTIAGRIEFKPTFIAEAA